MTAPLVVRGDARRLPLPDESVDLVVTSPPYFALRSYTDGGEHYVGQIGSEPTPAEYIAALMECTREWVRVLKPSGSIFVDLGDKYDSGTSAPRINPGTVKDGQGQGWNKGTPRYTAGRPKSLMLLPERYRIACVDQLGLIARAVLVWAKPNGLPESVTDRVRRSHEDWVHLTRQPRYFAAVDEIREPHAPASLARYASSTDPIAGSRARYAAVGPSGGGAALNGANPLGKLPGSVWEIATEPLRVPEHLDIQHFAAFPSEWPRRLILGWSPSGICTACGEGRRPVARQTDEAYAAERERVRQRNADQRTNREAALYPSGRTNTGGYSNISNGVVRPVYGITGYACACTPYTDHPGPGSGRTVASTTRAAEATTSRATTRESRRASTSRSARGGSTTTDWTPPPTRPSVILDPFGGTGTTAHVAAALGRVGISVDLSADYCRLAAAPELRDARRRKVFGLDKPLPVTAGQLGLTFTDDEEVPA